MDPLLMDTGRHTRSKRKRDVRKSVRELRKARQATRFSLWLWTELPAYRLGLLAGYVFAIWYGISTFLAGVPTFDITAPEGWTPIWSIIIAAAGPIGLAGIVKNEPVFRKIELTSTVLMSGTLFVYGGSAFFLGYGLDPRLEPDSGRVGLGVLILWLAALSIIRMLWLLNQVFADIRDKHEAKQALRQGK